jgi:hypothetical protein
MFRNKQDKTEYRNLPKQPRQMLEILAKLDSINQRLDQASIWAKAADLILHDVQEKLDTLLLLKRSAQVERNSRQRVEPVEVIPQVAVQNVYLDEVTPNAEPDKLDTLLYARDGKLKRVYYNTDPVGYIERKIYNATASHKTATCIFLSALWSAVNTPATNRRKHITAAKLVEHLLELLSDKRIIAVKAKPRKTKVPSGDIGFQLASSETPVLDRYSVLSDEEATEILNLFARWNNG